MPILIKLLLLETDAFVRVDAVSGVLNRYAVRLVTGEYLERHADLREKHETGADVFSVPVEVEQHFIRARVLVFHGHARYAVLTLV